ncbi:MAG TPA: sigma-54 dependent transcriptional regulator [Polyangiaceae bacterium]|jgi:DNA-binding NtrC family response regulator|nr:sigma-54 dependent transcriptional regulator [Polyangiaceae bacterium]
MLGEATELGGPVASPRTTGSVLIVEDDEDTRAALADALTDLGHSIEVRADGAAALARLENADFDAVLTDVKMPGIDGIELCRRLSGDRPSLPVLVMTAFGDVDSAMGALRAGAYDFITKPLTSERLAGALYRALNHGPKSPIVVRPSPSPLPEQALDGLVGSSAVMRTLGDRIRAAAPTDSTVLITGESGTGKELVAHALHRYSARAAGPFVPVSCAAVPSEILEAELFGHTRGAFTGASQARVGLLEQAQGGTLFLDEIGDMPLELQPRLLRALQERRLRPVGSSDEVEFDARVVAATNRDLRQAMAEGHFREDLFFRLNVMRLELPPLRDRPGDVLELARYFLDRAGSHAGESYRLAPEAERQLLSHTWPGNVRELENCIRAAVALASHGHVGFDELPTGVRAGRISRVAPSEPRSLEAVERQHILHVLDVLNGNKAEAARVLGINRATLYRKLQRYGLERDL